MSLRRGVSGSKMVKTTLRNIKIPEGDFVKFLWPSQKTSTLQVVHVTYCVKYF